MKTKILAYITRNKNGQLQLLVFDNRDYPDAGTQVPAGTVEEGEAIEAALFREVREESGLTNVQLVRKLARYESQEWGTIRHVFHLHAPDDTPDSWQHTVHGNGEDAGLVFNYHWVELKEGLELAGNQHLWLGLIGVMQTDPPPPAPRISPPPESPAWHPCSAQISGAGCQ